MFYKVIVIHSVHVHGSKIDWIFGKKSFIFSFMRCLCGKESIFIISTINKLIVMASSSHFLQFCPRCEIFLHLKMRWLHSTEALSGASNFWLNSQESVYSCMWIGPYCLVNLHGRFLRYSKWLHTFQIDFMYRQQN